MIALMALIIIAVFRSRIVESIILGSAVMDEYKFVNPSTPPACVKAFSLPPVHPDQIHFQPPTLPQNWRDKGAEGKQKTRSPNDRLGYNNIDYNNTLGNSLYNFQKMSLCILTTKGVLPLVPIQHYTPRHRAHGYFCRGCKPGFGGSHVGAFRIRRSPPFAIKNHRLPPRLRHAYYKTLLLLTAPGRLAEYNPV